MARRNGGPNGFCLLADFTTIRRSDSEPDSDVPTTGTAACGTVFDPETLKRNFGNRVTSRWLGEQYDAETD